MYEFLGNTNIYMYDLLGILSFIGLLSYNLSQYKTKSNLLSISVTNTHYYCYKRQFVWLYYKLSKIETWIVLEIIIISLVQHFPILFLAYFFGDIMSTGANYFGFITIIPFILFFFFTIIKVSPLKQLDLIVPAFAIALCFAKIGCFCSGCCNGIESANGLYNYSTNLYEFPVQLVESGIALLIFIFLVCIKDKVKLGTMYPIYLICYSSTRFFSEFLRHEDNIIGILKLYHLLCIAGLIIGIIEFILISKYNQVIHLYFENKWKYALKTR